MAGIGCGDHHRFQAGCPACQRIQVSYDRRRRRMIAAGTWQYRVPADTVVAHINALRAAGMTLTGIARTGHLAPKTVFAVMHEHRKTIQGPTAAAIFSVRPHPTVPAGHVLAVGTTRRVRAFVAAGYSLADIARRLDKHLQAVWEMAWERQRYLAISTHRAVADLYEQLSTTPGPSRRARNTGRRNDWAPPMAWDDDAIDDPAGQPSLGNESTDAVDEVAVERALTGQPVPLTKPERHHAVHRGIAQRMPVYLIAERLHMSHAVAKELAAEPLPDTHELAA